YDFNCIQDSRKRDFDIILQLGYTSSSIWRRRMPRKAIVITNMDGLEWKRTKYSKKVQWFLKYAESLAVKGSDYLIADSVGIQDYLKQKYNVPSEYIAYGSFPFEDPNQDVLNEYGVQPYNYNMLIARMGPENNIETILDGVVKMSDDVPFLVVGKHDANKFGAHLKEKFKAHINIQFLGGIYNLEHLNNLRYYSKVYFHGHTVGGTNPSLLEAMASKSLIVAHDNQFNEAILNEDAFYFSTSEDITSALKKIQAKEDFAELLDHNFDKIKNLFSWEIINNAYLEFMEKTYEQNK
ncbi:MAG: DUF1972 domain-containing protein, partial [Flavobacteriaceae bacterium]|nr:DUF1972 domain-containing protein [Flavobacteriaceae bacterium]